MRFSPNAGWLLVRIGIALVLFWFGINQILNPQDWVYYLPEWLVAISPIAPAYIVLINGGVEVVFGFFILFGMFLKISALLMGFHLALIALSLGNTPSGIRDWGLALATFALFFVNVDQKKEHR